MRSVSNGDMLKSAMNKQWTDLVTNNEVLQRA